MLKHHLTINLLLLITISVLSQHSAFVGRQRFCGRNLAEALFTICSSGMQNSSRHVRSVSPSITDECCRKACTVQELREFCPKNSSYSY